MLLPWLSDCVLEFGLCTGFLAYVDDVLLGILGILEGNDALRVAVSNLLWCYIDQRTGFTFVSP